MASYDSRSWGFCIMPQQRKVIISDNDPAFLAACEQSFQLLGFQTVVVPKHGLMLWDAIDQEQPDAVICNLFMPYCDVVHILEHRSNERTVPLWIALCTFDHEKLFERFFATGGTYVFVKPFEPSILAERIANYFTRMEQQSNLRRLPEKSCSFDLEKATAELLKTIGVPAHLTGYYYIKTGISLLFHNEARFSHSTKGLYQAIAGEVRSTYACVERNIRTAVEAAFDRGDLQLLESFFGSSVNRKSGKPNNIQFIATLYETLLWKQAANG